MKHIDKTVISKLPPRSKEVMWLDASEENSDAQLKAFINGKWQPVGSGEGSGSTGSMIEITYSQLKSLRDNSNLSPGCYYRITDYQCTTTQEGTQSAGHQFDIIVRADDKYALNENAFALEHEGDTYFSNANLSAWELKYCLDNDTNRFAWADPINGKGVIYYMKDEFGNECPYDFKNIMFKRTITLESGYPELDLEGGEDTWCYTFTATKYDITNDEWSGIIDGSLESPFEHMSDEGGSTFHHNIIKEYIQVYNDDEDRSKAGLMYLNDIVFLGYFEYNGGKDDYQYAYCAYSNTFGNDCYNNTFGNNCSYNTFGNDCYNNTFASNCNRNTFGDACRYNTFGNNCYNNTFGGYCSHNTFGNDCYNNTFWNDCYNNTFGGYCSYNTFGNNCHNITFGSSTQNPQSYFMNIIFESGNQNINLVCSQTTSGSSKCQNILVALGVNNTNTAKTITIDTVNQTNRTVVRSAADTEIVV